MPNPQKMTKSCTRRQNTTQAKQHTKNCLSGLFHSKFQYKSVSNLYINHSYQPRSSTTTFPFSSRQYIRHFHSSRLFKQKVYHNQHQDHAHGAFFTSTCQNRAAIRLHYESINPNESNISPHEEKLSSQSMKERDVPAILLLHGFFGSTQNLIQIGRKTARYFPRLPVYALDARNHGFSDFCSDHSYREQAQDIESFLDSMDHKEAILIGHSMPLGNQLTYQPGAKTSMLTALRNPFRIKSLISLDQAPTQYFHNWNHFFEAINHINKFLAEPNDSLFLQLQEKFSHEQNAAEKRMIVKRLWDLISNYAEKWVPLQNQRVYLMQNLQFHPIKQKFFWKINTEGLEDQHFQIFLNIWENSDEEAFYAKNTFPGPALFIGGTTSDRIKDQHNRIKKFFPSAEIQFFEGGHFVHAENHSRVFGAIQAFLEKKL